MLFSRQLSLASIIALCRALRHSLGAGISLVQVFRQQSERGPREVRPFARSILTSLEKGDGLSEALEQERDRLPHLFLALAQLGEETGHLAEIFAELESHYRLQETLRRKLLRDSMMPMIQLGAAFFILAFLIFILGIIGAARQSEPAAVFGLRGTGGAVLFLAFSFGSIALIWTLWAVFRRLAQQRAGFDSLLLHLPVVGRCLEAIVMSRFCTALHLTLGSGVAIGRALRLSLAATGNAAYTAETGVILGSIKNGSSLVDSLEESGLFTADFLSIVSVGEESGRVPEVMRHQAEYWNEEVTGRLKTATRLASMLVWLIYAMFMIGAIFNVASVYFGAMKL